MTQSITLATDGFLGLPVFGGTLPITGTLSESAMAGLLAQENLDSQVSGSDLAGKVGTKDKIGVVSKPNLKGII